MTLLEDIATYLAANSTLVIGTDLFAGQIPADAPDGVTCVYEYPGAPPIDGMGSSTAPQVALPRIQVVGRGKGTSDYNDARGRVRTAYSILHGVTELVLSGTRYLRIMALQEPFPLSRDDNQRVLFACNFEVYRVAE